MTSVPNHRQLLNGNNIFLLSSIILGIYSCAALKRKDTTNVSQDTLSVTIDSTQLDSVLVNDSLWMDSFFVNTVIRKDTYNIATILPLFLDSIHIDTLGENIIYDKRAEIGIELYQGMLIALQGLVQDSLDSLNVVLNVYDSHKDSKQMKIILGDSNFLKNDVLLGPLFNNCLRKAATFGKENKKPVFAPLSPSTNITLENPYYFVLNATIYEHMQNLSAFLVDVFPNKNYFLIHQEKYNEKQAAKYVHQYIQHQDSTIQSMFTDSTFHTIVSDAREKIDTLLINDQFDTATENVIILCSFDEVYVNHIINQLHVISKNHPITLIGMPNWENFKTLRTDQLLGLNIHVSSNYWVEEQADSIKSFIRMFTETFGTVPTKYSFQGYGAMQYVLHCLREYGISFPYHLDTLKLDALHTAYSLVPSYSHDVSDTTFHGIEPYVNFYENSFVHITKFDNYAWYKVK